MQQSRQYQRLTERFQHYSSFAEMQDPSIHFQQRNLPQGKIDNAVDEQDERYKRLSSVERGEPVHKRSLTRSEKGSL